MSRSVKKALASRAKTAAQVAAGSRLTALIMAPFLSLLGLDAHGRRGLSSACLRRGFLPVPVHFYHPIPDLKDLRERDVWSRRSELRGVRFDESGQLETLERLGTLYGPECDWPLRSTNDEAAFFVDNDVFSYGCAAATYSMVRDLRPTRVVEIGSGNSSKVIAQALDANGAGEHLMIDPYPSDITRRGLRGRSTLLAERVELVDRSIFDKLEANDILFIDSGHQARIGGDVNHLFLDVLPGIAPGVYVHVHDICLPYEYPRVYAESDARLFWTEQYLLQAFLAHNRAWEVVLAMYFLQTDHGPEFESAFPHYDPDEHRLVSSSFWMRRVDTLAAAEPVRRAVGE